MVSARPVREPPKADLWFPTRMCAHVYLHPHEHTCAHVHLNKKAQITGSEVAERWLVAMEMLGSRYQVLPCPSEPVFTFQNRGLSDVTWASLHFISVYGLWESFIPLLGENKLLACVPVPAVPTAACGTKVRMKFQGIAAQLVSSHFTELSWERQI